MKHGSLFTGIGGFDLGLEAVGFESVWQVESDPTCNQVLTKRFPNAKRYAYVETVLNGLSPVDIVTAGFPCQDISSAHSAKPRPGLAGDRSGLWTHVPTILQSVKPRFVIIENVSRWRAWVPTVRADLARIGYASLPVELSTETFGARHRRKRVFVVADAHRDSQLLGALDEEVACLRAPTGCGGDWWDAPPSIFRVDDGVSRKMDRLKQLGNAVNPLIAAWLGRMILKWA